MTTRDWLRQRPWLYRWPLVVAWMGLIFYLSAQPDLPNPGRGRLAELLSMGAHAAVFGVLALLWARALGHRSRGLLLPFVLTVLYALSDEFHQAFVPGRTPDPIDLLCDGLGALAGLWIWAQMQRRMEQDRP
jgi:VanZ family protein